MARRYRKKSGSRSKRRSTRGSRHGILKKLERAMDQIGAAKREMGISFSGARKPRKGRGRRRGKARRGKKKSSGRGRRRPARTSRRARRSSRRGRRR